MIKGGRNNLRAAPLLLICLGPLGASPQRPPNTASFIALRTNGITSPRYANTGLERHEDCPSFATVELNVSTLFATFFQTYGFTNPVTEIVKLRSVDN